MRPVGLPWASWVWNMRRGRMAGGGRPSEVAPSPNPTTPPSRPSIPDTLRPARMGSASSFSTNGDAFFLLPRPRGIVVLQGEPRQGEGRRLLWGVTPQSRPTYTCSAKSAAGLLDVYVTGVTQRAAHIAGSVRSSSLGWSSAGRHTNTQQRSSVDRSSDVSLEPLISSEHLKLQAALQTYNVTFALADRTWIRANVSC